MAVANSSVMKSPRLIAESASTSLETFVPTVSLDAISCTWLTAGSLVLISEFSPVQLAVTPETRFGKSTASEPIGTCCIELDQTE